MKLIEQLTVMSNHDFQTTVLMFWYKVALTTFGPKTSFSSILDARDGMGTGFHIEPQGRGHEGGA